MPLSFVGSRLWMEARDGRGGAAGFVGADSMPRRPAVLGDAGLE